MKRNKNPSDHKHVALYVSWNPYIVVSPLKILIPVGSEMVAAALSPSTPAVNMWCAYEYTANPNNPDARVANVQ